MNVLLTGGAGYIATHTCIELINAGHTAVIADNFSNSSPKAVKRVEEITGTSIPLYNIDVCDKDALDKVFAENKLDAWTHNMTIKKAIESNRISVETKRYLRTLKTASLRKGNC